MDDLDCILARAANLQQAMTGCWGMAQGKLAGVEHLYIALAAIRQQIITHAINDQNILAKANNIPRYYPARKVNKVRISIPVLKDNPVTGIPVPGIVIFCVRTI